MPPENLLLRVFADPGRAVSLEVEDWEILLAQARRANLTARLSYRVEDAGELPSCPTASASSSPPLALSRRLVGGRLNGRSTGFIAS